MLAIGRIKVSTYYGTLIGTKGSSESQATRRGTERVEAHCRTWVVGGRVAVGRTDPRFEEGTHSIRLELTTGTNRWGQNVLVGEFFFTPEGGLVASLQPRPEDVVTAWSEQWIRTTGKEHEG